MPFFEDYDKVHIGSVTRSQFHRVLSELEIGGGFCISLDLSVSGNGMVENVHMHVYVHTYNLNEFYCSISIPVCRSSEWT